MWHDIFILFIGCFTGTFALAGALMWCAAVREPGLREDAEVPQR